MTLPRSIQDLIIQFSRLPGIGPKTSERLVFSLFQRPKSQIQALINALAVFNQEIHLCGQCFNFADKDQFSLCQICADSKRDQSIICVVADSLDLIAIESTGYQGLYHILGGVVNPLKGVKIENLRVNELIKRLDNIKEVILAFDPNQEGEMTCYQLKQALSSQLAQIKITRLARGLPQGGDLDYADEITLGEALRGRREV
ncbi:MAG: recombination mediator RecR [Patescibacteria group bacterium]